MEDDKKNSLEQKDLALDEKPDLSQSSSVDLRKKPKKGKNLVALTILLNLVVSGLIGGLAGYVASQELRKKDFGLMKAGQGVERETESQAGKNIYDLQTEENAVTGVVEKSSQAVVSIIVTKDVPKLNSFFDDNFFSDPFFDPFGLHQPEQKQPPRNNEQPQTEKKEIGGGTGFFISEDGYIVTNRHVVEDSQAEYTVVMNNGEKEEAKVVARDSLMDLAILKVDSDKKFPAVVMGDSENMKVGQTVIAIGNSLGEFRNTVSRGIISGLKREVTAGDRLTGQTEVLEEVIQTDAAINPGNSGGPLFNLKGEVIGINVAMAYGAENVGFAIPIKEVISIYDSVKKNGKIVRPYLGVRYIVLNKAIAQANNLPFDYGILISRGNSRGELAVIPGSPADKAGLVENEIILEVDGVKLTEDNKLARIIQKKKVGDEISLKVWSKGKEKVIKVTLEENGISYGDEE